ncbi:MAG: ComF family protein [Gemmatimonadetes bacterium]|nr:ComF family protein [Gemmatimonadota bacterium]
MRSILAAARVALLDVEALALPAACLGCERALRPADEHGVLCAPCRNRLRPIAPPVCGRCGQPLDRWDEVGVAAPARSLGRTARTAPSLARGDRSASSACAFCRHWPAELSWTASAVWLEDGPARELVHALKYGGWRAAAGPMAGAIARHCARGLRAVDVLVPVPLGRIRRRERGHNQAAELATALGALLGITVVEDALVRPRETKTQTALAPAERRRNVSGAFRAGTRRLDGLSVAIVDDVLTTAATLGAAAQALAETGASRIGAVTFGRALVPK